MSLLSPASLVLLAVPLALTVAYVLAQRRRTRYAVRFTELHLLATVAPRRPGWWRHLSAVFVVAAAAAAVLAVARPVAQVQVPQERATVVVALDTSTSMQAADVRPDRMTAATQAAERFVGGLPERFNVALVTFDSTAAVVVPATTDRLAVTNALRGVQADGSTAIGEGVFVGLDALRAVPGTVTSGRGASATDDVPPAHLVLLSDGSSNEGRPVAAAAAAAEAGGVPVSTIAYGEQRDPGEPRRRSDPVPPDTRTLAALADATGGGAYAAADGDELEAVYADIGSQLGTVLEDREVWRWFVGGALVLLALGAIVALRTGPRLP